MKDRDVSVSDALKTFAFLGCETAYSNSFISVHRPKHRGVKQHLHKGRYDTLRRGTIRSMYRALGFTPEEFYGALAEIQ